MGYATVFVGRSPPPKDLVGRTLFALGSLLRGTGRALDSIGAAVEGPYATKDPREAPAAVVSDLQVV
jgi:hypothetical protein